MPPGALIHSANSQSIPEHDLIYGLIPAGAPGVVPTPQGVIALIWVFQVMAETPQSDPSPDEPDPGRSDAEGSSPAAARPVARKRPLGWRILRGIGFFVAGLILLVAVLLVAIRLYFSNERLRLLVVDEANARLPAKVELADIELSLISGIELRGLRLGPPAGFEKDVIAFDRVAVHWALWDLLDLAVIVDEVAIEGLSVCLEENEEHGRNLDRIIAALIPPAKEEEPELEEPIEPFELTQPTLPVRIEVRSIVMKGTAVEVARPDLSASLNRFGMKGRFTGEGDAVDLDLWVGLGDPWAPAEIKGELRGPDPIRIDVRQRLGLDVATTGLGDIRIGLDLGTDASIERGDPLPDLHLAGEIDVSANLLTQKIGLSRCVWTIGKHTTLEVRASLANFMAPPSEQRLELQQLELRSVLDELAPIVGTFVPGMAFGGTLALRADPLNASVEGLGDPLGLSPRISLALSKARFAMPFLQATGLDADIQIAATTGNADVTAYLGLGELVTAGQRFAGIELHLAAASPLAPWLGGSVAKWGPPPDVTAKLRLGMAEGGMKEAWSAERTRVELDVASPIDLILNLHASRPIAATLRLDVGRGTGGPVVATDLGLRLDARAFDFFGKRARAGLNLKVGDTVVQLGAEALHAPAIELDTDLEANGPTYTIHHLALTAADEERRDLIDLAISGAAANVTEPAPRIDALKIALEPVTVESVFALLPPSWRPPQKITGKVGLEVSADGTVPIDELMGLAMPPVMSATADQAQVLRAWFAFVERWSARFDRGMPFTLDVGLAAIGMGFAAEGTTLEGIDLETNIGVAVWGPYLNATVTVAEMTEPETVRDIATGVAFDIKQGSINLAARAGAGWYNRAELTRPLTDAGTELRLQYKIGGDLLLEKLAVKAPDRPAELTLDGLIIKPVRMFLQKGWRREGLPGVEAELRWRVAFSSAELAPVAIGQIAVGGGVAVDGSLAVADGVLALAGGLDCDALSLKLTSAPESGRPASETLVDTISGQLPFDLRLAFRPHPEAAPLAIEGLGFGGGKVGLLTSQHDIRSRPSRPVHYDRLLPYRTRRALSIKRLDAGGVHLENLELDARIGEGIVAADRIALHLLGGDVLGELALQLSRNNELIGQLNFKMSNIDASYFETLDLEPGPESELSGDINLGFMFGPAARELPLTMNLTKIGAESFDRFLQFLSNDGQNEDIEKYRGNLKWVTINEVAIWMRYEALNINLDYDTTIPLGIQVPVPFIRPIPREMLRRHSVGGYLDVYLQPLIDEILGPALGWPQAAVAQGD